MAAQGRARIAPLIGGDDVGVNIDDRNAHYRSSPTLCRARCRPLPTLCQNDVLVHGAAIVKQPQLSEARQTTSKYLKAA